ncbi:MAG: hypothetical protein ABI444_04140 [Candidatus Kapaibacterium sp.]|jgi:hypothetical protein
MRTATETIPETYTTTTNFSNSIATNLTANRSHLRSNPERSSLTCEPLSLYGDGGSQSSRPEIIPEFKRFDRSTPERSVSGIEHMLTANAPLSNYNTTTLGRLTFRNVKAQQPVERIVTDETLQTKLESLCESLRAKY